MLYWQVSYQEIAYQSFPSLDASSKVNKHVEEELSLSVLDELQAMVRQGDAMKLSFLLSLFAMFYHFFLWTSLATIVIGSSLKVGNTLQEKNIHWKYKLANVASAKIYAVFTN